MDLSIVVCRRPYASEKMLRKQYGTLGHYRNCFSTYMYICIDIVAHFVLLDQGIILSIAIERTVGKDERNSFINI